MGVWETTDERGEEVEEKMREMEGVLGKGA